MPTYFADLGDLRSVGITLEGPVEDRPQILRMVNNALPIARELVELSAARRQFDPLSIAAAASLRSFSALVTAAVAKCNLANPPEDIDTKVDGATGDLIYRCYHSPAHEWDLNGIKR
jgi:hypothetical protein